jgi:hypothetical protein
MKECEIVRELFVEVSDDEVDAVTSDRFREHLSQCHSCNDEYRLYSRTIQALSSLERIEPPVDFLPQLALRLDRSSPSFLYYFRNLFSGAFPLPVPAGVTALALIVVACLAFYKNGELLRSFPTETASVAHETTMAAKPGVLAAKRMPVASRLAAVGPRTDSPAHLPHSSIPASKFQQNIKAVANSEFGTIADRIGADNLTVESRSIDQAVESLKRMLPNIEGKLVVERTRDGIGEKVLRVMIPSRAYADLTTELINHGAVESGAGADISPPTVSKKSRDKVLLYIRFTQPR